MADPKKLFIKTYGCQMNVYDSERMAEALGGRAMSHRQFKSAEDADMILLNTCHIREKAAEKIYSELGRLKGLKAGRTRSEDRRGGLRRAGRGRRDHAPSAGWWIWWWGRRSYHRLPADGGACAHRRKVRSTPISPRKTSSTISAARPRKPGAGSDGLSDRAGRLRQVLRLLRGALYPRGRGVAPG